MIAGGPLLEARNKTTVTNFKNERRKLLPRYTLQRTVYLYTRIIYEGWNYTRILLCSEYQIIIIIIIELLTRTAYVGGGWWKSVREGKKNTALLPINCNIVAAPLLRETNWTTCPAVYRNIEILYNISFSLCAIFAHNWYPQNDVNFFYFFIRFSKK